MYTELYQAVSLNNMTEAKGKMLTKPRTVFCAILVVMLTSQLSWAAAGRIQGKATDATNGEPLPGVTIQLEGTSIGAATDLNGNYDILHVPAGSYTVKASYVGYKTLTVKVLLKNGEQLREDIKMHAVGIAAKEVVVTAQASGQNAAINQQLTSNKVVNIVSSARIQSLPDANAAESVGRLPGISLVRSGGEATQVVIRGLQPQYNSITIDGVPIPPTDPNDRGTNLSMISSNMLKGIEVYKTVTPDMDAAVLGGTVNFEIREAKPSSSGAPLISLLAQGGYNNLVNTYNDYKFVGSIEKRFLDNRFGVFVQGIVQRQNLSSDQFGATYYIPNIAKADQIALSSMDLYFYPREEQRYDGTLTLDYKLPDGKIDFVNLVSHGNTNTEYHNESYDIGGNGSGVTGNDILYGTQYSPSTLNVITDILDYKQTISSYRLHARLSHSYSENISPNNWFVQFEQTSAGTGTIPAAENPVLIARAAAKLTDPAQLFWQNMSTWTSFNKQRNIIGSIDIERPFNLSDMLSITLKGGGMYEYTDRYYNYDQGNGNLYGGFAGTFRSEILTAFPWMTQGSQGLDPTGSQNFPYTMFMDPGMKFGDFLNGNYLMNSSVNTGLVTSLMNEIKILGQNIQPGQTGGVNAYLPNVFASQSADYTGNEYRSAGYIMATINIGQQITLIPGVRYQGLKTSYTAAQFLNASAPDPYPLPQPHTDSTKTEYHGYWLPDVSLKYDPISGLSIRAAYTNTLAYPEFNQIIPIMDVYSNSVTWNNYALKPAQSHNYDLEVSVYNNSIGLLAVNPFLKEIDNLMFSQSTFIVDPSKYPGIPTYTKGFALTTYINNPYTVNLWGIEAEWQTHFWYLPNPFKGLVLNVNYTHIFSRAKYPYTITTTGGYPPKTTHTDTFYVDRLLQQPDNVVNLSIGYDYGRFSVLASMIFQSQVFNATSRESSLRSNKANYVRWDLVINQGLPWFGLQAFLNLNNLNSANDIYLVRGSGFPDSESDYGMTANLGLRWRLE